MTNISPPPADDDIDRADRAGQICASRRWQRSATGNPTLLHNGYRLVVVRHAGTDMYGYTLDRRCSARARWAKSSSASTRGRRRTRGAGFPRSGGRRCSALQASAGGCCAATTPRRRRSNVPRAYQTCQNADVWVVNPPARCVVSVRHAVSRVSIYRGRRWDGVHRESAGIAPLHSDNEGRIAMSRLRAVERNAVRGACPSRPARATAGGR